MKPLEQCVARISILDIEHKYEMYNCSRHNFVYVGTTVAFYKCLIKNLRIPF